MNILVVAAHPDDETILCGGTIAKLVKSGHRVSVSFFTRNDEAYFGEETQTRRRRRAINEMKKSARFLGYIGHIVPGFSDMNLQSEKGKLMRAVMSEIRRVKPDLIITHYAEDKHIDHRTLGEIVPEANFQSGCDLCGGDTIWTAAAVLQGEIDLEMTTPFAFDTVSIFAAEHMSDKIEAFNCYESVKNEHKVEDAWLIEKLKMCARLRGKAVGYEYGEAFKINTYAPLSANALQYISQAIA